MAVLFLGGLIGLTDFLWLEGFPIRSQLAFGTGCTLLLLIPYLAWTRHVRSTMVIAIMAASSVFLGNFFLYGSAYYLAAGFCVPLCAALFMRSLDAFVTLMAYMLVGIGVGVAINVGWWVPPYELDYKFQLVINGLLIIAAMSLTTIWRERELAAAKTRAQAQQDRLETIFRNGYGLMIEANHRQQIQFATGRLLNDLGYADWELVGRNQWALLNPADRENLSEAIRRASEPIHFDREVRMRDASGRERWVRISGGTFGAGSSLKWISAIQDIQEMVSQRNRVFEVSRLESLGEVCGGLAHDFNNLLTVIGINAEFIDDPRIRGEIVKARDQAMDLTAGLLTFARKQDFREQDVELIQFLENMQPLIERVAGARVCCCWQMAAEPVMVRIDPSQLQQVVINLVTNSLHAMPDGGRLTIACDATEAPPDYVLERNVCTDSKLAMVTISDNGIGMDEETKTRAVEPFFTTKPRGKGTGLGLATAHGAIRSAGGLLHVESAEGQGTSVSIFLPVVGEGSDSQEFKVPELAAEYVASSRVMIVEDREEVRSTLSQLLDSFGYRVLACGSAENALEVFADHEFDLIVSDVALPGMGGVELAERLLGFEPELKIVLISGYPNHDLSIVDSHPDAVRYLPKPFSATDLLKAINQLLAVRRQVV